LNANHLVALARLIERKVDRRFELIIVDSSKEYNISLGSVRIMRTIPHKDFLSLLASADLYIERCIDEELGITSFEAIAMGVPIVKLTHPRYWDRQDYKEDLILVRSFRELADKIAEYINNIDHYYHYYSKRCREFVLTKRTWDAVKEPFLSALKHISRQK
ncbi:MAG: glycosyltransferase, partial [Sulfolobales archaeon]